MTLIVRLSRRLFARAALVLVACGTEPDSVVVTGFIDNGWPGPEGLPSVSQSVALAAPAEKACSKSIAESKTDARGWFRFVVPASPQGFDTCLRLMSDFDFPAGQFHAPAGGDSIRLYCRNHGPTGSPLCLPVPWNKQFRWPGDP
jgi:hypothetical protein